MSDVLPYLVSIVVAIGGGAGVTGLLNVRFQKRLLGATARKEDAAGRHEDADAAEIIRSAAASMVTEARAEVAAIRKQQARMLTRSTHAEDEAARANRRADQAERRIARLEQLGGLHMLWDQEAQAEVQRLGGHLRPPPQLDDVTA